KCPYCGSTNIHQDEDVLDTWASSWLWAHDVFKTKEEQDYYYPTDTLVTAPDIIFFWVARMIMAGLHIKGDIPFRNVYFTSIIRDAQGRKMSKSLGNSPNPLEVIEQYGADALRFTTIYLAPLGQDVLFSTEKCEIGRNFSNKLWNAGRFLLMNMNETPVNPALADKHVDSLDAWIDSRFHSALKDLLASLEKFDLNNALKTVYSLVWNDFCDWYVELMKVKLWADDPEVRVAALTRASTVFQNLLKIVHPFMPFITEELWHLFGNRKAGESISLAEFPVLDESKISPSIEHEIEALQDRITGIRNIRGEMNIPPSRPISLYIKSEPIAEVYLSYIKKLGKAEKIINGPEIEKPKRSASVVLKSCEIFVPLEGLIDLDIEQARLTKEIQRMEQSLVGVEKKLSNEKFVASAPAEVVEKERQKAEDWRDKLNKLNILLKNLE
ncbi:MAG: class I tRNA ligase family protein, partial [Ignavibacteriales bacterium]|nr:class I tRNA ligase family protein [Ignavibacteriales bacterium]